MNFIRYGLLPVFFLMLLISPAVGQTCSCAGAPLISSQSLGTVSKGDLVIGLTYDFNNISKLYTGSDELENKTSERSTISSLMEFNYGLSNKLTITGTFTYIRKERTTGLQTGNSTQTLRAFGVGDGMAMLKYNVIEQSLWKPYQLAVGAGVKAPIGSNSLKADGLALNADMQPGTGAWDGIGWLFLSRTLRAYNTTIFSVNSFRKTGTAERFNKDDEYRFGNELVSSLGVSGAILDRYSYNIMVKYRTTSPDQRNESQMPSTGGEWLNLKPGLSIPIADRFSVQLSGEIPLYQNVNGTQPTTSYILSASLFFNLNKNNRGFIYGVPTKNK